MYESTSAECPDVNRLAVRMWSAYAVEEFQRLDLSQMDLSEFTNSIQLPDVTNKQTAIIDKINSHINLIK